MAPAPAPLPTNSYFQRGMSCTSTCICMYDKLSFVTIRTYGAHIYTVGRRRSLYVKVLAEHVRCSGLNLNTLLSKHALCYRTSRSNTEGSF